MIDENSPVNCQKIRDKIAETAMLALLSGRAYHEMNRLDPISVSRLSYRIADAMIEEGNRRSKPQTQYT